MERKTLVIIGAILAFAMIALTIAGTTITQFAIKDDEGTIKAGFIGALSGDASIVGKENLRGVELAIDKINSKGGINGKKIELIIQDDQYDAKQAISAYKALITKGVDYIFIVTYDGYLALAEQAENDNIILINSIDSSEEFSNLGKNAFSVGVYDESIGFAIADYLNNKEIEIVGLITNIDDAFPMLAREAFKKRFRGKTIEENYGFNTNDFRSHLTKLLNQEHIVVIGWEETGRIVKQARELNIEAQIYGIDTFASEDFRKNTGDNYDGLMFSFWKGSENNKLFSELVESYEMTCNKEPDNILFVAVGFDSASVLLKALENCDKPSDILCVKTNIENTNNLQGAAGTITVDIDHVTRSIKETMFMYEDGEIVEAK